MYQYWQKIIIQPANKSDQVLNVLMVDQALAALVKDEGCASAAAKDNTDMSVMFIRAWKPNHQHIVEVMFGLDIIV